MNGVLGSLLWCSLNHGIFRMDVKLSDEQSKPIDAWIFRRSTISAVKAIREAAGVGIRETEFFYT